MQLEIGRRYAMRNGYITEPLKANLIKYQSKTIYPFSDGEGRSWTSDGQYIAGEDDERDIVREHVGPGSASAPSSGSVFLLIDEDELTQYDDDQPSLEAAIAKAEELVAEMHDLKLQVCQVVARVALPTKAVVTRL